MILNVILRMMAMIIWKKKLETERAPIGPDIEKCTPVAASAVA